MVLWLLTVCLLSFGLGYTERLLGLCVWVVVVFLRIALCVLVGFVAGFALLYLFRYCFVSGELITGLRVDLLVVWTWVGCYVVYALL